MNHLTRLDPPALPASALFANREHRLTAAQLQQLASMPAAAEWFANIDNPLTRRAYQADLVDFCTFVGLAGAYEFRAVTRALVLAWRAQLEQRGLAVATIRRKLAALASLFDHLLEAKAVAGGNPVHGVKRPPIESNEGKTPSLGNDQAKGLLNALLPNRLKGQRDQAILAVLFYHGLRPEERALLQLSDLQERRGIKHLRVLGKGGKLRYLTLHPVAATRLPAYLGRHRAPGSTRTLSIWWWPIGRRWRGLRSTASVCTACAPPRRPMPWSTMPILPRCRLGWAMPTSAQPDCTTAETSGRKIHLRTR